jgi:hypothetical protein
MYVCLFIYAGALCIEMLFLAQPLPLSGQQQPAPYQRGPPQEYLEAITNKRLIEEVG